MTRITLFTLSLLILVLLSAFFSSSETAFSVADAIRLEHKLGKEKFKTHKGVKLFKDNTSTLFIILVGNNIVNLTAATVSMLLFVELNSPVPVILSTITITILILVFGELLPKVFANKKPENFIIKMYLPLYIFKLLCVPLTFIMSFFTSNYKREGITEKELLTTLKHIELEGEIEKEESSLIHSAITFDDKTVKTAFTKWNDVIFVNHNDTVQSAIRIISKEQHSRIPVVKKKEVIGVVSLRNLIKANPSKKVEQYMNNVSFISRNVHLDDALTTMQRTKQHLMIVTNKVGTSKPIGILALEDLIEQLVGEIYDETEITPSVMEVGRHNFRVEGSVNVEKAFKEIGAETPIIKDATFYEWVLLTINKPNLKNFKTISYDHHKIKLIEDKGLHSIFNVEEL